MTWLHYGYEVGRALHDRRGSRHLCLNRGQQVGCDEALLAARGQMASLAAHYC